MITTGDCYIINEARITYNCFKRWCPTEYDFWKSLYNWREAQLKKYKDGLELLMAGKRLFPAVYKLYYSPYITEYERYCLHYVSDDFETQIQFHKDAIKELESLNWIRIESMEEEL